LFRPPLCPFELVTVTLTGPADPDGVVAVMIVLLRTATLVAALPPKVTVAPDRKPVPVMVTGVPPAVVPELGDTVKTVGGFAVAGAAFNATACIIQPPAGVTGALAV